MLLVILWLMLCIACIPVGIIVHEFGHYFAVPAHIRKNYVTEISVGDCEKPHLTWQISKYLVFKVRWQAPFRGCCTTDIPTELWQCQKPIVHAFHTGAGSLAGASYGIVFLLVAYAIHGSGISGEYARHLIAMMWNWTITKADFVAMVTRMTGVMMLSFEFSNLTTFYRPETDGAQLLEQIKKMRRGNGHIHDVLDT